MVLHGTTRILVLLPVLALLVFLAAGRSSSPELAQGGSLEALVVNNNGDGSDLTHGDGACDAGGGQCTLRAAIQEVNNSLAPLVTVTFAPGVTFISPATPLPVITSRLTIDGTASDGRVELDGSLSAPDDSSDDGLTIDADNSVVRGLIINSFNDSGIEITANGVTVAGNWIGLATDGVTNEGNGGNGVSVFTSSNVTIGGTTVADRNVISGSTTTCCSGVYIQALVSAGTSGNKIQGNYLGTNATGTAAIPNRHGIALRAPGVLIGGPGGARNVISGNASSNIFLHHDATIGSANNTNVQNNYIGTNAAGTGLVSLPASGQFGVDVISAINNTIGAADPALGNLIRGNHTGIRIGASTNNSVQNNTVRLNAVGITVSGSTNNTVLSNTITLNSSLGIQVTGATGTTGNKLSRNVISANANLGIDLGGNGVTANDPDDPDPGPNLLQNFPMLTTATRGATQTAISGTLDSRVSTTFTIEFFGNTDCDSPSTNGEGEVYLGELSTSTNASGDTPIFTANLANVSPTFDQITATATSTSGDANSGQVNNTSEFSDCIALTLDTDGDGTPDSSDSDDDNDGVPDVDDDCAGTVTGTVAADGCPDPDGDGISTFAGDNCPNTANEGQEDFNNDGQGDACDSDVDGDGVTNGADQCNGTPLGTNVAADGCPDPDDDGLSNADDNCDNVANPGQEDSDGDGIGNACESVQLPKCDGKSATVTGIQGTPGNDVIVGTSANETINGGGGNDTICGRGGTDTINGGSGNDRLFGENGNDKLGGGVGKDYLNGGRGTDTGNFAGPAARTIDLATGQVSGEGAGVRIANVENINGSSGHDVIRGNKNKNVILGSGGNDTLSGRDAADVLEGGNGNDTMDGGPGSDNCKGGPGTDTATKCEAGIP